MFHNTINQQRTRLSNKQPLQTQIPLKQPYFTEQRRRDTKLQVNGANFEWNICWSKIRYPNETTDRKWRFEFVGPFAYGKLV